MSSCLTHEFLEQNNQLPREIIRILKFIREADEKSISKEKIK